MFSYKERCQEVQKSYEKFQRFFMIFYEEIWDYFCGYFVGESSTDKEREGIRRYEKARGNLFERRGEE